MMGRDAGIVILAYLLGSLPFAYLVAKYRGGIDIRQVGEGNAGARNVFHVVGPGWGALVALLDIGKGWVAYRASRTLGASETATLLSGFTVILGHNFPFLRWNQGGKGVSVTLGFLLGLLPGSTTIAMLLGLVAQLLLRDANRTVVVVCAAMVFAPLAFGQPVWICAYVLSLMLTMAIKKIIDRQHEQQVWAQSGWTDGATPGFHSEPSQQ